MSRRESACDCSEKKLVIELLVTPSEIIGDASSNILPFVMPACLTGAGASISGTLLSPEVIELVVVVLEGGDGGVGIGGRRGGGGL